MSGMTRKQASRIERLLRFQTMQFFTVGSQLGQLVMLMAPLQPGAKPDELKSLASSTQELLEKM